MVDGRQFALQQETLRDTIIRNADYQYWRRSVSTALDGETCLGTGLRSGIDICVTVLVGRLKTREGIWLGFEGTVDRKTPVLLLSDPDLSSRNTMHDMMFCMTRFGLEERMLLHEVGMWGAQRTTSAMTLTVMTTLEVSLSWI